jgi:hypothetical protein
MKRSMWRAAGVAAIVLAMVGTASYRMEAQSKKAAAPRPVPTQTLGPVRYAPPATTKLEITPNNADTGWCYVDRACKTLLFKGPVSRSFCIENGGRSWITLVHYDPKDPPPVTDVCEAL